MLRKNADVIEINIQGRQLGIEEIIGAEY